MALEEYRRKRDFGKTPEPAAGRVSKSGAKLSYLIQKHDATRLHYDFRLELDGVLLSWAVTKGPSINPADKRLAVRTEDHPLSYGSFEGTIPKGQYGGGTVMLWDQGTWEPRDDPHAGLKKGHLAFILHGKRLRGAWDLIRMRGDEKRENWLLIKGKDAEAGDGPAAEKFLENLSDSVVTKRSMDEIAGGKAAKKSLPRGRKESSGTKSMTQLMKRYPGVQLATLVEEPPEGDDWIHEVKFDGYRVLGFVSEGEVRIRTRNNQDWTGSFPAIVKVLERLDVEDAVLDMEAVVLDSAGKSNFQSLQGALSGGNDPSVIVAFAFDLLHLDGKDLTRASLLERKEQLQAMLKRSKTGTALRYSDHVIGDGSKMLAQSCKLGLEGIVSKEASAPYQAGRQRSWLKSKCSQRQEFIIAGFSDAKSGGRSLGALYLAYHQNGDLHYAGKVGTGFTMQSARDLTENFSTLSVARPIFDRTEMREVGAGEWRSIHWVKPELVCEVEFTEWTQDGRIRHPSFQGLREDKPATAIKQEKPVSLSKSKTTRNHSSELDFGGARITHPDRVISETGHVTKGDVAAYYHAVAPLMLPRIAKRPISLLRCPEGFDKECFYQRNPGKGLGPDVFPFEFNHEGKKTEYLYIESEKGLMSVVQMNAVEIHPWGSRIDSIDYPEEVIFDLDPAPGVPFEAVKLAAQDLRARLKKSGLDPRLKCTGGKGLHVMADLPGKQKWPEVKEFATSLANEMVTAAPQAYTATMSKAKRVGKIFIDYFRNDYTSTAIADYSVRARPGAPVALPLDWKELKTLKSADQFTIPDVLNRLKKKRSSPKK